MRQNVLGLVNNQTLRRQKLAVVRVGVYLLNVADRKALFDSNYERVVAQFKAGTRVKVQLRFWPTWPATGTHATTLSLIGFTRAYGELAECR